MWLSDVYGKTAAQKAEDFVFSVEGLELMLGVAGLVFPPADVVSLVIDLAQKEWGYAALDVVGILPLAGDFIKFVAKRVKAIRGAKTIAGITYVYKAADTADALNDVNRGLDALDAAMDAGRAADAAGTARKALVELDGLHDGAKALDALDNVHDSAGAFGLLDDVYDDVRVLETMDDMQDTARTLDRADAPRATQYSYRGGEVSPDLRVEARILDESGNVAETVGRGKNYRPYTPEMRQYIIPPKNGHEAYLERIYIRIREAGMKDIPTIAKNTGLPEQDLIKLKEHLFLQTHNLSVDGRPLEELYFQADCDIAYGWQQAMKGELSQPEKDWFEQLLNHELTERALMEQGMPLRDPSTYGATGYAQDAIKNAHDKANLTAVQPGDYPGYDGGKELLKYYNAKIEY